MSKSIDRQLREWWLNELGNLTGKVMREEERRQDRQRDKAEKLLGEYRTYADAQEAYGCGVITEKQFDRIADLLERTKPVESRLYREKLNLLQELYQEQKKILADLDRWEATHGDA